MANSDTIKEAQRQVDAMIQELHRMITSQPYQKGSTKADEKFKLALQSAIDVGNEYSNDLGDEIARMLSYEEAARRNNS